MESILERKHLAAVPTPNAEKLWRWARAQCRRVSPEILVVRTEHHGRFAFEGWQLGHGVEGPGFDGCGNEWQRREATIYLTSDALVLCKHVLVGTGWINNTVISSMQRYESDLELLHPMALDGPEDADECVLKAARQAVKKCEVFGVFGVVWVCEEVSSHEY